MGPRLFRLLSTIVWVGAVSKEDFQLWTRLQLSPESNFWWGTWLWTTSRQYSQRLKEWVPFLNVEGKDLGSTPQYLLHHTTIHPTFRLKTWILFSHIPHPIHQSQLDGMSPIQPEFFHLSPFPLQKSTYYISFSFIWTIVLQQFSLCSLLPFYTPFSSTQSWSSENIKHIIF